MAQALAGPVAQPRSVPLAYTNSGQQGLKQTLAALELLDKYAGDIFARISTQVAAQRQRVGTLGERAEAAADQVKQLSEQKKGATVLCPNSFPKAHAPSSEDIYFSTEAMLGAASGTYRPAPRPSRPQGIDQETEEFEGTSHSALRMTRPEEEFLFESLLPKGSSKHQKGAAEGLGRLPPKLPSVSSLLLFNTAENPYKEYRTLDPLESNTERARRGAGQGQSSDGNGSMSNLDQGLPENTETFTCDFVPALKETPGFELPEVIPGLEGVADVEWEVDFDWEPIAPSGGKNGEWNAEEERIGQEAPAPAAPATSAAAAKCPAPPTPPVSIPVPTPPTTIPLPVPNPNPSPLNHNLPVPPPLPAPLRQPPPLPVLPQQQAPPLPAPKQEPSPTPSTAPIPTQTTTPAAAAAAAVGGGAQERPNPTPVAAPPALTTANPTTTVPPTPPPLPPVFKRNANGGPPTPPPRPPVTRLGQGKPPSSDSAPTGPLLADLSQARQQLQQPAKPPAAALPVAAKPPAPGGLLAEIEALRDQGGAGVLKPASERPKEEKQMSPLEKILLTRRRGYQGQESRGEESEDEDEGRAPPLPLMRSRIPLPPKPKVQAPPPPPSRMFARIQDTPKEEAGPEWD